MKFRFYALLITVLTVLLPSCLTNNGDIGEFYGEWALTGYTIDGVKAPIADDTYYWLFQSDIVSIIKVLPHHEFIATMGSWRFDNDILSLDFTHTSADLDDGENTSFNPPAEMGIPGREVTRLRLLSLTGGTMRLQYTSSAGISHNYTLKKIR